MKPSCVVVIGTGRSGTHWMGNTLGTHPQVYLTSEKQPQFDLVCQMAFNESQRTVLMPELIAAYHQEIATANGRIFVDKSHPALWIANKIALSVPNTKFIVTMRSAYGTIASMLNHSGVQQWFNRWDGQPNQFLGVTPELVDVYDSLPIVAKCALRWKSHNDATIALLERDDVLPISYENFILDPGTCLQAIEQFLELETALDVPPVKTDSLDKWKNQLTDDQLGVIDSII